jgi:hypothetical protein
MTAVTESRMDQGSPMRPKGRKARAGFTRRVVLVALPVVAASVSFAPAAWSLTLKNGHGISSCGVSGTLTFSPPLKTGSSGTSTVAASVTLGSCGGNDFAQSGAVVTAGTGSSVGHLKMLSSGCSIPAIAPGQNSATGAFTNLRIKITWTTSSGKAQASTLSLLNGLTTWTGADGASFLPSATESLSYTGAKNVVGSMALPKKNLNAVKLSLAAAQDYDAQVNNAQTGCASSAGLSHIDVSGSLVFP